ncbi:MAG: hypothetical protein RBT81_04545 [Gammaproteobacteria bacterium]|jgi:hypothetical protein|nr:hypothetical protein [Gammaproteobacteria bacterium]
MTVGALLALAACATVPESPERTDLPPDVESPPPQTTGQQPPETSDTTDVAPGTPSPPSDEGSSVPDAAAESAVIQFADAWLELADEARSRQYQQARADYESSADFDDLVRLGLLTTLRTNDRAAASRINDEIRSRLETDAEHALAPLARVVLRILDERARAIGRLAAQNETLQRQLDELKAIEEQLRERGRPEPIQAP